MDRVIRYLLTCWDRFACRDVPEQTKKIIAGHRPARGVEPQHGRVGRARRVRPGGVAARRVASFAAYGRDRDAPRGASLAEIGQVLRHREQRTTAIYAKVDRAALRALARPWPSQEGGGAA